MRSTDHITNALACLHWLRIPERIDYKVAVLTYKVLHGSALQYLGPLVPVADLPGRRTSRSGGTNRLMVPSVRRSTVGDRAFTVAGSRVWNTLPEEITTSETISTFSQQQNNLKLGSSENHIRTSSTEPAFFVHFTINLEVALLLWQSLIDWLNISETVDDRAKVTINGL